MRKQAEKKFGLKRKEFLMRKQAEKYFLKNNFQKSKFSTKIGNRSSIMAKLMPPTSS